MNRIELSACCWLAVRAKVREQDHLRQLPADADAESRVLPNAGTRCINFRRVSSRSRVISAKCHHVQYPPGLTTAYNTTTPGLSQRREIPGRCLPTRPHIQAPRCARATSVSSTTARRKGMRWCGGTTSERGAATMTIFDMKYRCQRIADLLGYANISEAIKAVETANIGATFSQCIHRLEVAEGALEVEKTDNQTFRIRVKNMEKAQQKLDHEHRYVP